MALVGGRATRYGPRMDDTASRTGTFLAIGAGIGVAFMPLLGPLALPIGVAIGLVLGAALDARTAKR
jgi:hypothetical protein